MAWMHLRFVLGRLVGEAIGDEARDLHCVETRDEKSR